MHAFHGAISSSEAEKLLVGQEKGVLAPILSRRVADAGEPTTSGTYLIRVSNKDRLQPFVISKVSRQSEINHQRITYNVKTGKFSLDVLLKAGTKSIESTGSLVEFIKEASEDLYLKRACPGSMYGAVFTQAHLAGYLLPGSQSST